MSLGENILKAFAEVTKKDTKTNDVWVKEYKFDEASKDKHQFTFFLKPEVTAEYDGVDVAAALNLILKRLEESKIDIGAVRVLNGDYLNEKNIMGQHYGVISSVSRNGVSVITDSAKKNLEEVFAKEIKDGAAVLGAHQFLAQHKDLNAVALRVLNDNLGTKRLGGGTYAFKLNVLGQNFVILNPFHPYQLVPYTTPGHAIIVIEGLSAVSWKDLRNKVCGVTDPEAAEAGSIRKLLLEKKSELKLKDVNKSNNGCHMSAGPLEALVELKRFFDISSNAQLNFGAQLAAKGLSDAQITKLASNPDLTIGDKSISAFDASEELDAGAAVEKLAAAASSL